MDIKVVPEKVHESGEPIFHICELTQAQTKVIKYAFGEKLGQLAMDSDADETNELCNIDESWLILADDIKVERGVQVNRSTVEDIVSTLNDFHGSTTVRVKDHLRATSSLGVNSKLVERIRSGRLAKEMAEQLGAEVMRLDLSFTAPTHSQSRPQLQETNP